MFSFWIGSLLLTLSALIIGALLSYLANHLMDEQDGLTHAIDELLPQSQCGQCGYPGCKPYAKAIAQEGESINKCIPGGKQTLQTIAALLDIDPNSVIDTIDITPPPPSFALIDEANCIGCTQCITACPVDAIIGSHKMLHTVMNDLCTGCELCINPCPMQCISMVTSPLIK